MIIKKQNKKFDIHLNFVNFFAYLRYDLGWLWVDLILSTLCTLEVNIKLLFNKRLCEDLECADVISQKDGNICLAETLIPKNTDYCNGFPFFTTSKLAKLFFGHMSQCYCYYIGQGDFSFIRYTMELSDGLKCCGINTFDDIEEDEEEQEE